MSVTIRDVAHKAGVSPITVSRAFSGTHPVAEETQRKVFEAAKELGYVPDLLARALVHKQSPIIGVIVLELANPFFVPILDAVQAIAWQKNYMLMVSQSQRQLDMERASVHQFRQMRVAGVLITPATRETEHLQLLKAQGTPVVFVARRSEGTDYVTFDELAGGRMVSEHLIRLGHRKIGCVAHDEPHNAAVQDRVHGFRQVLQEAGCTSCPTIHTQTVRMADAIRAADTFLNLPERPTAVFVTADRLAIGFVHRLQQRGLRVPSDVAVVSYDDIRYAEFLEVPLTTVALPKHEVGQLAAQVLFERIEENEVSEVSDDSGCQSDLQNLQNELRQVTLEPRLVIRGSCGAKRRD
jgi:LacI family transcriptional regulator